jgi:nucleoid-associated protein YgaU
VSYTDNGTNTSVSRTNLNLITGQTYYFSVRGVDVAGNIGMVATSNGITVSSSTPVVEPTIVPTPQPEPTPSVVATPTITTITSGQQTADTTPTIGGTGPAGAGAFIVVDRKLVRTVPIASNGTFVVDLLTPLSLGNHLIAVRAKTGPGLVSDESAPIPFTVVAPGATSSLVSRSITNVTQPTVNFTVQAPSTSTLSILLDGAIIKTLRSGTCVTVCTVSSSIRVPSGLSVGSHTLSLVTVTDAGQLSAPTTISTFAQRAPSSTSVSPIRFKQSVRYTVQSGDSLWSIAQKVYGDGSRWTEIQRANTAAHATLVSQPGALQIGWTLQLPPG